MTHTRHPLAAALTGCGIALTLLLPSIPDAQTPLPPDYPLPNTTPTPVTGTARSKWFVGVPGTVSPFGIAPLPGQSHLLLGPVRPYTDDEYGRLVLSTLAYGRSVPVTQRLSDRTLVEVVGENDGTQQYARAEARVLDVLDRGKMLTDTGEIVKLRGVRVSTERDPNEVVAFYGREAMRTLRTLTLEGAVTIGFEDPLRSGDGTLMAIVRLRDGTELNRLILERGLGRIEQGDFPDDRRLFDLEAAEKRAKDAKIGIWSARQ